MFCFAALEIESRAFEGPTSPTFIHYFETWFPLSPLNCPGLGLNLRSFSFSFLECIWAYQPVLQCLAKNFFFKALMMIILLNTHKVLIWSLSFQWSQNTGPTVHKHGILIVVFSCLSYVNSYLKTWTQRRKKAANNVLYLCAFKG